MVTPEHEIEREASRLLTMSPAQARAAFSDRIARAFLLNTPAGIGRFQAALAFNARLATMLRERAEAHGWQTIWGTKH